MGIRRAQSTFQRSQLYLVLSSFFAFTSPRYDAYGYGGPMMQGPPQWGPNLYTRAPVYDDFYNGFDDFNRGPAPGSYGGGGFPPMQSQIPPLPPISSSVGFRLICN
jgi:hypothetical protein